MTVRNFQMPQGYSGHHKTPNDWEKNFWPHPGRPSLGIDLEIFGLKKNFFPSHWPFPSGHCEVQVRAAFSVRGGIWLQWPLQKGQ